MRTLTDSPGLSKSIQMSHDNESSSSNNSSDNVRQLNQLGISMLMNGHANEAADCFRRAIAYWIAITDASFNEDTGSCIQQMDSLTVFSNTDVETDETYQCTCNDFVVQLSRANTAGRMATIGSNASPMSSNKNMDEGLYIYREAIHIDSLWLDTNTQSSVLHYNLAQANLRRGEYKVAQQCLERGLQLIATANETIDIGGRIGMLQFQMWHTLGYCLYRQFQADQACKAYENALQLAVESNLGVRQVAATHNCLGVLHLHVMAPASPSNASIFWLQSALTLYEDLDGPESPSVATVLCNLGRAYFGQADHRQALYMFERAWAIHCRESCTTDRDGDDLEDFDDAHAHWDQAVLVCHLAQAYHCCGELDLALVQYFEFLERVESLPALGQHDDVAIVHTYMADIHTLQGDLDEAKTCYRNVLSICRNAVDNATHVPLWQAIPLTLYRLGHVHHQLGECEQALRCCTEGLEIDQQVLCWNDPQIVAALMNVAQIQRELGLHGKAMVTYCRLHSIHLSQYGANSPEVAATLSAMGLLQHQQANYSSSFDLFMQALKVQHALYGPDAETVEIAATMSSLGLVLYHQGVYDLSTRCYSDALRMQRHVFGPDHCENAMLCYNLATICLRCGDEDNAIEYYKETVRIERTILTQGVDGGVAQTAVLFVLHLGHLATLYQRHGDFDSAIVYLTEALAFEQQQLERAQSASVPADISHYKFTVGQLHNALGNLYLQTGQVALMMTHFIDASRAVAASSNHSQGTQALEMVGMHLYDLTKLLPHNAAPMA
jgi:tetratricopeptide (TPR) repeat protein